jgi:tol-pal system protein YbgF
MKKILLLILFACSSVYAERKVLAPVTDNSMYPSGGSKSNRVKPSANAMYEVFGRLEQMQSEIQQLRGMVEEQSQLIARLKKRQGNIYSDLDLRIQELSGGMGDESGLMATGQNGQVVGNTASMTRTRQNLNQRAMVEKQLSPPEKKKKTPVTKNQKQQYQAAYETLRNGHNSRAIAEFKSLLSEFPSGEYAASSQYWLGEAYKVNKDTKSAIQAFSKVVSHYSSSSKVADALLKLGYIEMERNNTAKAREYLTEITAKHPGTTAAHLAKKRLMKMGAVKP